MPSFKDLTGQTFGRLYVVKLSKKEVRGKRSRYYWLCQCECGKQCEVRTDCLTTGNTESCGCIHKEVAIQNVSKHHSHKMSGTCLYHVWQKMKYRCCNQNSNDYERYGGRGITVCDEWLIFEKFALWAMSRGYSEHLSIDRIDNNKGYYPENCRWTDSRTQARNRRSNIKVIYEGKKITLAEASEKTKIAFSTLRQRKEQGKQGKDLFRAPRVLEKRSVVYDGRHISLQELSRITGININTLYTRYTNGKRGNDLIAQ